MGADAHEGPAVAHGPNEAIRLAIAHIVDLAARVAGADPLHGLRVVGRRLVTGAAEDEDEEVDEALEDGEVESDSADDSALESEY